MPMLFLWSQLNYSAVHTVYICIHVSCKLQNLLFQFALMGPALQKAQYKCAVTTDETNWMPWWCVGISTTTVGDLLMCTRWPCTYKVSTSQITVLWLFARHTLVQALEAFCWTMQLECKTVSAQRMLVLGVEVREWRYGKVNIIRAHLLLSDLNNWDSFRENCPKVKML